MLLCFSKITGKKVAFLIAAWSLEVNLFYLYLILTPAQQKTYISEQLDNF